MKHSRDKKHLDNSSPQKKLQLINCFVEKTCTACNVLDVEPPDHPTCNIILPHIASMTPPRFEAMRDIREYCLDDMWSSTYWSSMDYICTDWWLDVTN